MQRCRRLLLAVLTAVVAIGLWWVGGAAAQCAPPSISVEPTSIAPGGEVTVTGENFGTACATGAGPHSPDVVLTLVQGERTFSLDTVRAGTGSPSFSTDVTIPADAAPGSATVTAQGAAGNATRAIQIRISTPISGGGATTTTTAPSTSGAGEGAAADDLASTGLEGSALVVLAIALLGFGYALEWASQALPPRATR